MRSAAPLPRRPRVLFCLPDPGQAEDLARRGRQEGWETAAGGAPELLGEPWDAVVTAGEGPAEPLLRGFGAGSDPPAVLLLSGFGTLEDALAAVRRGAFDCLPWPTTGEQVVLSVARALEQRRLSAETRRLRASGSGRYQLGRVRTRDARLRRVLELAESVADTRASVLIRGETGTGKSLLARMLHERSSRAAGPFVVVDCGALPAQLLESELFGHVRGAFTGAVRDKPGRFEEAHGGTLFLDEISSASSDLQMRLLRAIQERVVERVGSNATLEVDVRLVFATNRDLRAEVEAGRFREDLYWRVHVVALELPPLRERPGDIPLLAEDFRERWSSEHRREVDSFEPQALELLCAAPWPGNVRQLENTIERAVLLARGPKIAPQDLGGEFLAAPLAARGRPRHFGPSALGEASCRPQTLKEALAQPEREILVEALEHNGWNRQRTAAMLGINRTTLFNKMRKHDLFGLEPAPPREEQR